MASENDNSKESIPVPGMLDDDVFRKLDSLVCRYRQYLQDPVNIYKVAFPENREYVSCDIRKMVEDPDKDVDGVRRGKGPVWNKCVRQTIKGENTFPDKSSGNLYMLHVMVPGANDWRPKYIGVSKSLKSRLQEHVAGPSSSDTSSQNWKVAHALHRQNGIGLSFARVVRNKSSTDDALCGYVERRIIEWLKDEAQVNVWGQSWNEREG